MAKYEYVPKQFKATSLDIIDKANDIIEEYMDEGLKLTLRQLYYQFVARGLIANRQTEYKRLGSIVSDARLAGLIDWKAIEDRTRYRRSLTHWDDPAEIVESSVWGFHMDHWAGQQYRPEVWIEKEALAGVVQSICEELDVPYFPCKGYVSQSEMRSAAVRMKNLHRETGQVPVVIHLGDHDPSGIDMTRDIIDRMEIFRVIMGRWECNRIALNIDQVREYNPPPNPAKMEDSRYKAYIASYGHDSWELDALEPRVMRDLIRETVEELRDDDIYLEVINQEKDYKKQLQEFVDDWRETNQ